MRYKPPVTLALMALNTLVYFSNLVGQLVPEAAPFVRLIPGIAEGALRPLSVIYQVRSLDSNPAT